MLNESVCSALEVKQEVSMEQKKISFKKVSIVYALVLSLLTINISYYQTHYSSRTESSVLSP